MKVNEMILYCLIYPILTMTFFMIWVLNSTLADGNKGMTPLLVGIVLLVVFAIEMTLILIFKKRLIKTRNKIIGIIIAFLLYEIVMWLISGHFILLVSFQKPFWENLLGAYSFSSVFSLIIILLLILLNNRIKKTLHNTGYNLWLVHAHSENPHGFSSGLGFVCYISCSIHATAQSRQTLAKIQKTNGKQ